MTPTRFRAYCLAAAALTRLAGQRALYLARQLRDFNKRERTSDNQIMHTMAREIADVREEIISQTRRGHI